MPLQNLNLLAVLAAALSSFLVGGLWYSALFGAQWRRANGFTDDAVPAAAPKTFIISFVLSLFMALNLAAFLNDPKTSAAWGATAGFLAGFGWVAMGIAIVSRFERRPWSYVFVNGGYLTVALTVMGLILGAWR